VKTPPDRAEQVADIVEQALEVAGKERAALIDGLCGGDQALRDEVESLLAFSDQAQGFIETPAYEMAARTIVEEAGGLKPGQMLDNYRIVSLIGEGGMGEVYLADDLSLGRKVAIKLLKYGFGTANVIRQFHQEERILAGLTHPHIAQLYGGAVTPMGVPYFVMEYVEGERLDDYCRQHDLSIRQRLALFQKICAAVAYAHRHLVIHRDIKPANIRVSPEGEPKLLDFGIAKLLDPAGSEAGPQTMTFGAIMTPEYASPEQVRGEDITTTSDVYALGVVLYELLTGQRPYRIERVTPATLARAITEQEPARPSTALSKAEPNPAVRLISAKSLRGDLDNIVMKAMRKETERRYQSVGQLSEDIRRYSEELPVLARKDTLGYRTSKFVARNRVAVSAGALLALAILTGLVVALWEARKADRERDVAQREQAEAERTSAFLQEMLGAAAPEAKGADVKVVDLLAEASRRARDELEKDPGAMVDVLGTLGRTYVSLGLFEPAAIDLRAALDASLKTNGEMHPTTANTMGWLGLALYFGGKNREGEALSRRAISLQRALHPGGNAELGVALFSLGMNLIAQGHGKEAEPNLEEAVDLIGKYLGKNHGYYLATLTALALAREGSGNTAGAESLYRRAIEAGQKVEPRYRIFLAQATGYYGLLLTNKGEYDEAEKLLRQSATLYVDVLGDPNSSTPVMQAGLGRLYFAKGDYAAAEKEFRKALTIMPKFFPPEHSVRVSNQVMFGLTLTRLGKPTEGEPLLREALEIRRKVLPEGNPFVPLSESALGECLAAQKRYGEAEPLLISGYTNAKSKLGEQEPRVLECRKRLAKLYEAWGKTDRALSYQ
jgi:serine/threonine-protein kinase